MLSEFYDYIAKKINSYFLSLASEGSLPQGESFCLKLDNDDMVSRVTESLRRILEDGGNIGSYSYSCGDGSEYNTFTIKLITGDEVIIASQINGMTNDFLCATLRNAANESRKSLLMISSNLIDSAKSGSRDLSASGMPFHANMLMDDIRSMASSSTQLSNVEKQVLVYELNRRDADVFSDKASLYEYSDLLAIMSSGTINSAYYPGFRLFPIDGKNDYQTFGESQIDKEIRNNNSLFEKIDRGIRFGDLEKVLAKDFEESFILKIEKEYKDHQEEWSKFITYAELLAAMEKKQAKTSNPLNIDNNDISAYGDLPINALTTEDRNLVIRNEGSQTAKRRTKSIFIFNPDHYSNIHLRVDCNTRIPNSGISKDDAELERDNMSVVFAFSRQGCSFHKVQIEDTNNSIVYVLKVCIIDLSSNYLYSVLSRSSTVDFKSTRRNSRIKIVGVGTTITINPNGENAVLSPLEDNGEYSCSFDEKLLINSTEDELASYGSGIRIDIDFSGVSVPLILYPDVPNSVEITGRRILRDKFESKKSFQMNGNQIFNETQEFFAKANLLKELQYEQLIIEGEILSGYSLGNASSGNTTIEGVDIQIPDGLKRAYLDYLHELKNENTIPTLAYLSNDLLRAANKYVEAFDDCFDGLNDGDNLSPEQENALYLGTLSIGKNCDEILLTPFHPLNVKYQLLLITEQGFGKASDVVVDRLNSLNLLPYIQRGKKIYKVSDQQFSKEWKYYAPVENRKYRGSRRFVSKLVEEKISEFISHFRYIFDDINNRTVRINLINMGDCSEVFIGLSQFFIHAINKNADIEKLARFELHIYDKDMSGNVFNNIKEYSYLKSYLADMRLSIEYGTSMNSLEGIIARNVECYFHKDNGYDYEYSHLSFYEMESEITSEQATMSMIETGVSLGGVLSGIPSSKYGQKYRTGFGTKYALSTELTEFAMKCNSLFQVEKTGNPYYSGTSISTQIDASAENKMEYIYQNSNWVVFVDPKVDLDFFCEKEAKSDLLIIHYSDQYTSSSGYDAITVTHKSHQYSQVIQEYLVNKGISANKDDVHGIINLFNAINGNWLLRLISSKKANKESTFGREKISIVAAIKFMLAFLKHDEMLWIPVSLEEMLRVSGGAGLSKDEGILSAKNLGFEKGPTSDDLLFVGINTSNEYPRVFLYPVEVKTGNNDNAVIKKAFEQASSTASGLKKAFNPGGEIMNSITYKVNRNFLMQLLVNSCKKMQVYHVDDSQDWDIILEKYRECLLNEEYVFSEDLQEILGKGAVLSFKKALSSRRTSFKEDSINYIEMPENDEFDLILKDVLDIYSYVKAGSEDLMAFADSDLNGLSGDLTRLRVDSFEVNDEDSGDTTDLPDSGMDVTGQGDSDAAEVATVSQEESENPDDCKSINDDVNAEEQLNSDGINVIFGTNEQDGNNVVWKPNDTTQVLHTNTGIIGTMGSGKTQFTKSLITQLYLDQHNNVDGRELGILIFDYKGDYNESKQDFVEATNAKIYKPYHLPFNPLALTKPNGFKPLLPTHTANSFKDTLSRVYGLGPKQQNTLMQCIIDSYEVRGIKSEDPSTWDNTPPTFETVYNRYSSDDEIKKGDSLSAALDKLHLFQVFESDPSKTQSLFEILNGVVVIDLSSYDPDIQSLIIAITLDLFYSQMQAAGSSKIDGNYRQLTRMILVDEADNFMSEGFPSLKKILKEGREFGVGTILSTQFLKHFASGDDYAKYILTWVVHNVSDLKGSDVEFVFNVDSKGPDGQRLYSAIKSLTKHHSIIKIGNNKQVYVKDKAFWELYKELN